MVNARRSYRPRVYSLEYRTKKEQSPMILMIFGAAKAVLLRCHRWRRLLRFLGRRRSAGRVQRLQRPIEKRRQPLALAQFREVEVERRHRDMALVHRAQIRAGLGVGEN